MVTEPWERKLRISTRTVNINTGLEPKTNRDQKTETAVASISLPHLLRRPAPSSSPA